MSDNQSLRQEAEQVLANADRLYSTADVELALDRMAREISSVLHDRNPLVLCPMLGAVIFTGRLLPRLDFSLELEYIHISRYQGQTHGGAIHWLRRPPATVAGRTLLVLDDILDQGLTMRSILDECRQAGAGDIFTAVLVDKKTGGARLLSRANFTGLEVPDRYVFGYGMDYKGYLRNSPGIYAVKES